MVYWKKHPNKDLEAVLGEFHEAGWTISRAAAYYRVRCACKQHQTYVHISPSDPNYIKNKIRWLYRQSCYKGSVTK